MYSTGKSLPVSVVVESEEEFISKYEEFEVLLEFALIYTALSFITVIEMLRHPTDVIESHKDT